MGTLHDADIVIGAQIDTEQAEKSAQGLTQTLNGSLSQGASQSRKASALVSAGLNALSVAAGNLLSQLARTAAQAIATVVNTGLEFNQQMENYSLAFENLLGDAGAAADALAAIKEDAAKTPFDVAGLVSANRLLISTGQSAEQARQVINALGNAVSASGGGSDELQRMAANLQQIANVGKAEAVDIKQFAYAGIDIYGLLADYTGKTREEVQDLTVSYDLLAAALTAASAEGGRYAGAMEAYSQTLKGQLDTLKDNAAQLAGALTEGLFSAQKELVAAAAGWVDTLKETLEAEGPGAMAAAGVQIVAEMALGIVQAAPELAGAAFQTVADFVSGILQNLPAIANTGGQMIAHLITGLAGMTADLGAAVLQIVEAIIGFFLSGDFIEVGVQIIAGIIQGFVDALPQLVETVLSAVGEVVDKAKQVARESWNALKGLVTGEAVEDIVQEIDAAANPYHRGSEKNQDYWEQAAEHYRKTGQDQRQGNYSPALDFDFTGLGKTAGSAAKQVETLADKLAKAGKALSGSRSAYAALTEAAAEYNETGRISAATWQEIMTLAPEYQALLTKEGDKLKINEQAYAELSAAQRQEIEALVAQNGTTAETIALLDEMIAGTQKAGTAFDELRQKLEDAIQGGPLEVIGGLAEALASGDWTGAAKALAEGLWLTLPGQQQDAISGWITQAVEQINAGFAADGWAGLVNAGAAVVQGLAEGITSGESVFLDAVGGLLGGFSGIGEKVLPAVSQAALSLLNALNLLVPGIDLASGATAVFNAILDANPIILVVSLLGMLGAALYGFAQTNTEAGDAIRSTWAGVVDFLKGALRTVLGIIEAALEAVFASYNIIAGTIGKLIGLEEIHFDLTSWLDHDDALEENTDAIRENTDLIRNPPRYQTGGGGPTTGVTDYSAMLAAARAAILSQNAQTVSRYDAGSGTTAARLSASWRGQSTTVLNLDGREIARATKDYMDEELAF